MKYLKYVVIWSVGVYVIQRFVTGPKVPGLLDPLGYAIGYPLDKIS